MYFNATDEEIKAAARIANAEEFIEKLLKGYDTEVGEGGNLLSIGQKQLISLARAILAQPEIFIMDEATSSLDPDSSYHVNRLFLELKENYQTMLLITHKEQNELLTDHVRVLENGILL